MFAAGDMMALGVMMRLRRAGVDVPAAVAIGGFDDIPLARLLSSALTTMRTDIAGLGTHAVAPPAQLIAGEAVEPEHGIELRTPELVVRDTTTIPNNGNNREETPWH